MSSPTHLRCRYCGDPFHREVRPPRCDALDPAKGYFPGMSRCRSVDRHCPTCASRLVQTPREDLAEFYARDHCIVCTPED